MISRVFLAWILVLNVGFFLNYSFMLFDFTDLFVGSFIQYILKKREVSEDMCLYSAMVWLLNPFTFTIGTRGNCEPIVCAMILWIIICLINGIFLLLSMYSC